MTRFGIALAAVALLVGCAEVSDTGSVSGADGSLDCVADWSLTDVADSTVLERTVDGVEADTPFAAMEFFATRAYGDVDYSIHVVNSREGTVVMGALEVMAMTVEELPSERFAVTTADACGTPFGFVLRN